MKRLPFSTGGCIDCCSVLVPETEAERESLINSLDDQGVRNSMTFNKNNFNGRLNIPTVLTWARDGSVRVTITIAGQVDPADAWLWLVETDAGTGLRVAYWGTQCNLDHATPW